MGEFLKVTKRREGDGRFGPMWRVLFDGRPTPFRITKSMPPRYRQPQMWDVLSGPDEDFDVMFDAPSLEGALSIVATIALQALKSKDQADG